MSHNYQAAGTNAAEVIAMLDETNTIHFAYISEVFEICCNGERYSFQASDVISSALSAMSSYKGHQEVPSHMAGWVAYRSKDRVQVAAAKQWSRQILCRRGAN